MHWTNSSPHRLDRDNGPGNSHILSSQSSPPDHHQHVPRQIGFLNVNPGRPLDRSNDHPSLRAPGATPGPSTQPGPSSQHGVPRKTGFPDARCPQPNPFNSRSLSRTPVDQHGMDYEGWGLPVPMQQYSDIRERDARYLYGARHQYGPDPLVYPGHGYQAYGPPPYGPYGHYPYRPPPYNYHDYGRAPHRQHPYEPLPHGHQGFYDQPRPLCEYRYPIPDDSRHFTERSSRPEVEDRQTIRHTESSSDDTPTTFAMPASSSAISEHAKFDLYYMEDDFSDEDLSDEDDTADFIDKDTASLPDEGLNSEENLPEESLSECVFVFEENQRSENSCNELPAAEDPTADNTKVSCDEDPDQHDEDSPCKEVESADFPTKHDNRQGKKEEILPGEFVSLANELQCDFPMQVKNLVTRILVSNQDRTVTLRRNIRNNKMVSIALLFAMLM
ncbi:hypothetical protein E4U31_000631, partial [Claviceps sp. LM219 group G6]